MGNHHMVISLHPCNLTHDNLAIIIASTILAEQANKE